MTLVRRALFVSSVGHYGITAVQLVSTMLLARLLTPHEIGVYSVAIVFMGFIQAFRDMGVGEYLAQERELTPAKLRSAAGAVLCTSWLLAPVVFFAAGPVAVFYREPGLVDVLHVLAINLLLIPFGAIVQAYLRRQMIFGPLQVIRIGSTVVQAATGVGLAWAGHGFMSLAWGSVAGVMATVLLANCYRPRPLRALPSFRRLGEIFRFGGKSVSMTLLLELGDGLPELIVGRALGMTPLGFYNRARGQVGLFHRLFIGALTDVGTPFFARIHRENRSLHLSYQRMAECVLGVAWPLYACMAILAFPMVRVLYGPQWTVSAALVPVLCLGAGIGLMLPLSGQLLTATGRINQALIQNILQTGALAAMLALCSSYGLKVLAWGVVAVSVVMFVWRYVTLRNWAFQHRWLLLATKRNGMVAAATALGPLLVRIGAGADSASPLAVLILAGVLAPTGWLLGLGATGHPLAVEIVQLIRRAVPWAPVGWMLRRVMADD